jgi:hypothetical protein
MVGSDASNDSLMERLLDARGRVVRRTVQEAGSLGPAGNNIIAEALRRATSLQALNIVAAIGHLVGDAGYEPLKQFAAEHLLLDTDLQCAVLLALARRSGSDITSYCREMLTRRSPSVREYAIIALAAAGDDSGWEDVFTLFRARLAHPLRRRAAEPPTEVQAAIVYLVQDLTADRRSIRLVRALRHHWSRLTEGELVWLHSMWPEVAPGGSEVDKVVLPDPLPFRSWIHNTRLLALKPLDQ